MRVLGSAMPVSRPAVATPHAELRPVPGVGRRGRPGSGRRQALEPVAARPRLRSFSRPKMAKVELRPRCWCRRSLWPESQVDVPPPLDKRTLDEVIGSDCHEKSRRYDRNHLNCPCVESWYHVSWHDEHNAVNGEDVPEI